MRASRTLIALASGLPVLLAGTAASAHISLLSPTPRQAGDVPANNVQLKSKPCGQTTNKRTTDKVTTYTPGQKVDIKIKEFIDHPGYFAVAFDPDGDDSFPFPRAMPDKVVAASDDPKAMFPLSDTVLGLRTDKDKNCYAEAGTHECTISITIPNMLCQNCTLQVTQFMTDKLNNGTDDEYYYQCADIKIEGTLAGGSGGTGGGGGGGGAGGVATGGSASGGAAGASAGTGTATGGVSTGGTGSSTAGVPATAGTLSTTPTAGSTATTPGTGGTGAVTNPASPAAEDPGGCGVARRTQGGASALLALGLLFALGRRRRAR